MEMHYFGCISYFPRSVVPMTVSLQLLLLFFVAYMFPFCYSIWDILLVCIPPITLSGVYIPMYT